MIYTDNVFQDNAGIKESFVFYDVTKRIFDFTLAVLLMVLLIPFFILTCIIIYLETGSAPIFAQQRAMTLEGSEFRIFKFRTLRKTKTKEKESSHIFLKVDLSGLVTFTGYILRKTGLDEIPQLLNIIMGEMSLIGPRPLSLNDLQMMKESEPHLYNRRKFIRSKPGISGYWQIYGERQKGVINLIEHEEFYEMNRSLTFDLFLMTMTLPIVLFAKHSDAIIGRGREE
jgi:lipopolysaccharide/colanic/teichoic acid biosynthesis glycosyltransferase